MNDSWSFETKQIHAGQTPDGATNARAVPIYQTTSFTFRDTEHAAALFGLTEPGNIYSRIMNPTQGVVEERIAALEGGVAALAVASGQAAETIAILNLAQNGDHIVSSPSLYGGTYNLFHYTLPKLGIEVSFVSDPDDLESWRAAVRPNTKAFFAETISNPKSDILDIEGVSGVAHAAGVPLIVDNTVPTPYLVRPFEWGADIIVHSTTKYLGGHGTAIGGVIVDGGKFDWAADKDKFPGFNQPDPSYHGLVYAEALGPIAYIIKARVQLLRDLGSATTPFNAFLLTQGLETLSLRIERHVENAEKVAAWLEARDEVASVAYAGLPSSPWYGRKQKYAPRGAGAVLGLRDQGRDRGGPQVRRRAGAAQPRRQHRRRAVPGHPPGVDHPLAALARGAGRHWRDARAGAALGRPGGDRRHPRRPRRRLPRRQGGLNRRMLAPTVGCALSPAIVTMAGDGLPPTVDGG